MTLIHFLQQFQSEALTLFFRFFTFFGDEAFYVLILPVLYWAWHRDKSTRLFFVVMLSLLLNVWLKALFQIPRPPDAVALISATGYAFPSGHAQGSATLWIMLALLIRKSWMSVLAAVMIFFIALSRIYLGVHYPSDILGGWAFAIVVIAAYQKFHPLITAYIEEQTEMRKFLHVGSFLLLLSLAFPGDEALTLTGALFGFYAGHLLFRPRIPEQVTRFLQGILIVLIGVAVVLGLYVGLKKLFPPQELFRFIRYACIGFWIPANVLLLNRLTRN